MKLRLNNLTIEFSDAETGKRKKIIDNLSLEIHDSSCLIILGQNGTGKTTLIKSIVGLQKFRSGQIFFDQLELTSIEVQKRAAIIGYVPQETYLPNLMTVKRYLELVFYKARLNQKDVKHKIEIATEQWKVSHLLLRKVSTLSGGEKKIVQIIAATIHNPNILLMDEPDSFLDEERLNELSEFLFNQKQLGKLICLVTHNLNFIQKLNPNYLLFENQRQICLGGCQKSKVESYLKDGYQCQLN
jgi:ABC-type multidrug transport system ATPase subunit